MKNLYHFEMGGHSMLTVGVKFTKILLTSYVNAPSFIKQQYVKSKCKILIMIRQFQHLMNVITMMGNKGKKLILRKILICERSL